MKKYKSKFVGATLDKFVKITFAYAGGTSPSYRWRVNGVNVGINTLGIYRPEIVCNDGFHMSVQGSNTHYCEPMKNVDEYESMEIGYPSKEEPLLLEYAEEPNTPTESIYGYVPCSIIQNVINKHGGIDLRVTFKEDWDQYKDYFDYEEDPEVTIENYVIRFNDFKAQK